MFTFSIEVNLSLISILLVFWLSLLKVFNLFLAGFSSISTRTLELFQIILPCLLCIFKLLYSFTWDLKLILHPGSFLKWSAQLDFPQSHHLLKLCWEWVLIFLLTYHIFEVSSELCLFFWSSEYSNKLLNIWCDGLFIFHCSNLICRLEVIWVVWDHMLSIICVQWIKLTLTDGFIHKQLSNFISVRLL